MLYLVATPIGNLGDMTFRALEVLKSSDYILCEDTRHSLPLLRHYGVQKPLKSYHKFNEASQNLSILEDLRAGKQISLISDAGTPGISDPGMSLVALCVKEQLSFTAIPGPCALVQALCCSGLGMQRFQFWGFLARKENELKEELRLILNYPGTTICYESPHRLLKTLEKIQALEYDRFLVIARELTKKFEEIVRGNASELIAHWEKSPVKGEIVLLISPPVAKASPDWAALTPAEHVQWMEETYSLSHKEAIKLVAELRGVPKRDIYQLTLRKNEPEP